PLCKLIGPDRHPVWIRSSNLVLAIAVHQAPLLVIASGGSRIRPQLAAPRLRTGLARSSSKDARRRGGRITCIRRAGRLAGIEGDRAIAQLNVERALEHKKEIVRLVMLVPMEGPFELGHHDVVGVIGRNRVRRETVGECRELFGEIGWCVHGFSCTVLGRRPTGCSIPADHVNKAAPKTRTSFSATSPL